jgi:hypothetical protein
MPAAVTAPAVESTASAVESTSTTAVESASTPAMNTGKGEISGRSEQYQYQAEKKSSQNTRPSHLYLHSGARRLQQQYCRPNLPVFDLEKRQCRPGANHSSQNRMRPRTEGIPESSVHV